MNNAETVKALASDMGMPLHPWQERLVDLMFDPNTSDTVRLRLSTGRMAPYPVPDTTE